MNSLRATVFVYNHFKHDARVLRHCSALAEAGYEVVLLALAHPDLPARERVAGFEVVRLDSDPVITRLARKAIAVRRGRRGAAPGSVVKPVGLARPGLRTTVVGVALGMHLTSAWLRYRHRALAESARAPAALWIANDLDTLPVAVAASRRSGGRLLYDSHELYVERGVRKPLTSRIQAAAESRLIGRANALVTVNDSIADELSRRYGVVRPTVVRNVPDRAPVDEPMTGPDLRAEIGVDASTPLALYLGGMTAGRGLEEIIEAAAQVQRLALALVGPVDPAFRVRLDECAHNFGARMRILDPVPEDQVVALARAADVGLVPYRNTSLNNYLSLPNKLFEYLAAGVPVVASDFPELRRVVKGREAGVVCNPDSPADIARAIRTVLADSARFGAGAREAGREFNWEYERPKLLDAANRLAFQRG